MMKTGRAKVAKVPAVEIRSKSRFGRTALHMASGMARRMAMIWL